MGHLPSALSLQCRIAHGSLQISGRVPVFFRSGIGHLLVYHIVVAIISVLKDDIRSGRTGTGRIDLDRSALIIIYRPGIRGIAGISLSLQDSPAYFVCVHIGTFAVRVGGGRAHQR